MDSLLAEVCNGGPDAVLHDGGYDGIDLGSELCDGRVHDLRRNRCFDGMQGGEAGLVVARIPCDVTERCQCRLIQLREPLVYAQEGTGRERGDGVEL